MKGDNTRGHLNWIPSGGCIDRRNEMSDASCMLNEKSCAWVYRTAQGETGECDLKWYSEFSKEAGLVIHCGYKLDTEQISLGVGDKE